MLIDILGKSCGPLSQQNSSIGTESKSPWTPLHYITYFIDVIQMDTSTEYRLYWELYCICWAVVIL